MRPLLPILVAALAGAASAGEIRVPADQPDLTAALAAAAPGDVIRVQTAADQAPVSGASILVDKPITIVGEPFCRIDLQGAGLPPTGGLELAGPGHGEVVLIGLDVGYQVGFEDGLPSLAGGGFDAVRIHDSSIRQDNLSPTGTITRAFPAVDLTGVGQLTVVASDLLGGWRYVDTCVPTFAHGDGEPAIAAPGTSVLLIDSSVTGGSGGGTVDYWLTVCPPDLSTVPGAGGDGVVAGELFAWGSTITPGLGAIVYIDPLGFCTGSFEACGSKPDGQPFVVSGVASVNACSRLTQASPRVPVGGTWTVDWDPTTPGCAPAVVGPGLPAFLFVDLASPPAPFPVGTSYVYLSPASAFLAATFPSDQPVSISASVPGSPLLSGLPVSAQVLVGSGELSGPVRGRFVP